MIRGLCSRFPSSQWSRQGSAGVSPLRDRVGSWDGSRARMKDATPIPGRHQLDHAVPIVIHVPEEDMPLLARWVRHAMASPTRFWSMIIGVVAIVITLG